jgi:hypothetical protein
MGTLISISSKIISEIASIFRMGTPVAGFVPPKKAFPSVPEWEPTFPADLERTASRFAYYNQDRKAFVVFLHGTCVIVDSSAEDAEGKAKRTLDEVYKSHRDFRSLKMDDGHWLIEYLRPVYNIIFEDEARTHWGYIEQNYRRGIYPDEVLAEPDGAPVIFDETWKVVTYPLFMYQLEFGNVAGLGQVG